MGAITTITDLSPAARDDFDCIIDVRSPAEFADDHLPGAINLPVLSDAERAQVGALYVQQSKFEARRVGASYIAANLAAHLNGYLADRPRDWRPLVYCWRGGMRSNAAATILDRVGWKTGVVAGGYKTWRRAVTAALHDAITPLRIVLVDGQTGVAKTEILAAAAAAGAQTLDLETLAAHRGSVFGAMDAAGQPSQKIFESRIFAALQPFDRAIPVLVEAESNRIGKRTIPRAVWQAMRAAPRIVVRADPAARAAYLLKAYDDIAADRGRVAAAIDALRPWRPGDLIETWLHLNDARDYEQLVRGLIDHHYDPLYERSRKRRRDRAVAEIDMGDLSSVNIVAAARKITALAHSASASRSATMAGDERAMTEEELHDGG